MTSVGEFLRKMRARRVPEDAGGASGRRRRTPGLRREEVAERAGMSVDWYVRLEQGRATNPSATVLDAVARALELSAPERKYLYRLARGETPAPIANGDEASPSLVAALGALGVPALILGPRFDVLARNEAGNALFDGFGAGPFGQNAAWFTICDPRARKLFADHAKIARETVGTFRGAFARQPRDPRLLALLAELSSRSPLFVDLWNEPYVAEKAVSRKRLVHPRAGLLDLTVHAVSSPEAEGQMLVFYVANDGATRARLVRLG